MEKADQVRLNHELLIWVGFTLTNGVWSYPDGVTVDNGVPYFPESLDAIFKWLVPKIIGGAEYSVIITQNLARSTGYVRPLQGGRQYDATDNHSPALALCLAIQKLIRSK